MKTTCRLLLSIAVVLGLTSAAPAWHRCHTAAPVGYGYGYAPPVVPFGGGFSMQMQMSGDASLMLPILGRLASAFLSPGGDAVRAAVNEALASRIPGTPMTREEAKKLLDDVEARLLKAIADRNAPPGTAPKNPASGPEKLGTPKEGAARPTSPQFEQARSELRVMVNQASTATQVARTRNVDRARAELRELVAADAARQNDSETPRQTLSRAAVLRAVIADNTPPRLERAPASASAGSVASRTK